ncbi:NPCBM/NEW2 domain-containing protein [Peribacillus glennii]|nr:NPCBM/NEW2 domain-containing protein [Peribacillus glennii]
MKKISVIIVMLLCFGLSFSTTTSAKAESVADLKKKNAALEKQVASLKAQNAKLKKSIPTVSSGKIFTNGVQNGTSRFLSWSGRNYVEVDDIIPVLTNYTDNQIKYDATRKALYLGVMPSKGIIALTNMKEYSKHEVVIDYNLSINNKRYSKNLLGTNTTPFRGKINYKIDGKYSSLKFFYGMSDYASKKSNIVITGDGNELFHSGELDYQTDAKYAEVDLRGIKFLTIDLGTSAVIGNPTLSPK